MEFREAVKQAFIFGADQGVFTFVVRSPDGSHWWSYGNSPQTVEPQSGAVVVWSRDFLRPFDVGQASDAEWEEWLDINAVEMEPV